MESGEIKGSAFESAVTDVTRLVEEGVIKPEALEEALTDEDRLLLDGTIMPSMWYPLGAYGRLVDLLRQTEGGGREGYLVDRGRRAAQRLYEAGLYRQLDAKVENGGARFRRLMELLGGTMFKDSIWHVSVRDDGSYHIEVEVKPGFPECARLTSQGFIEFLGSRARGDGRAVPVASSRPSPTRLIFDTRVA